MPRCVLLLAALLPSAALPSLCFADHTSTVRGTVELPPAPRNETRPLAYWRVENGRLPIGAADADDGEGGVVALEPEAPIEMKPQRLTVDARALKLAPALSVLPVGSTVEFRNDDPEPRTLFVVEGDALLPREPLGPGKSRELTLSVAGEYRIRDAEHTRARATILAVSTPYTARVDEDGSFRVEVPDGRYRLRVYARGAWTPPQLLEVSHGARVTVKVPAVAATGGGAR